MSWYSSCIHYGSNDTRIHTEYFQCRAFGSVRMCTEQIQHRFKQCTWGTLFKTPSFIYLHLNESISIPKPQDWSFSQCCFSRCMNKTSLYIQLICCPIIAISFGFSYFLIFFTTSFILLAQNRHEWTHHVSCNSSISVSTTERHRLNSL